MKEVKFETMIRMKNGDYILVGKGLERLRKNTIEVKNIKTQIPMSYVRIKTILLKELDYAQFIDFWREVKIYKIFY